MYYQMNHNAFSLPSNGIQNQGIWNLCLLPNIPNNKNQKMRTNFYLSSNNQENDKLLRIISNLRTNIDQKCQKVLNQNIKTTKPTRVLFKKEEDERIKKLVDLFGTRHWELIAHFMEGRTAKQCRDRYSNYLVPGYFQGEWSSEEDEMLIKLYQEKGSKWSLIQKSFVNRSANNIKNRWYYFLQNKVNINKTEKLKEIETKKSNEVCDSLFENDEMMNFFDDNENDNDWINI